MPAAVNTGQILNVLDLVLLRDAVIPEKRLGNVSKEYMRMMFLFLHWYKKTYSK